MEPNQPSAESARIEELETRLASLESAGVRSRGAGLVGRVIPPEAVRHFKAAGREQLLGMRSLVDHWIKRMGDDEPARPSGREEITIE